MKKRLSDPLGSYSDRDEFQIGRMLVWVIYPSDEDRSACLYRAEKIFSVLESDIVKVEERVTVSAGSSTPATVIGITIEPDGSASYECTFFDGEHEDEFISIKRNVGGGLVAART
ncbi:hypothetical protein [Rheinheimera sp.]|uniref:hypothetical protein n=1 Tax=Rheinheimera sp. TaxID=1869214 RepID=UPI00404823B1